MKNDNTIIGGAFALGCGVIILNFAVFLAAVWGVATIAVSGIAFWPAFWVALFAIRLIRSAINTATMRKVDFQPLVDALKENK